MSVVLHSRYDIPSCHIGATIVKYTLLCNTCIFFVVVYTDVPDS